MVDKILGLAAWSAFSVLVLAFVWLLSDLITRGCTEISVAFLLESPANSGRQGGIGPILVSTAAILTVTLLVALPLGMATAVLLSEFTRSYGRFATVVRRSLDALAGVPSIVFGLFGNAFFSKLLGLGFSILSGGLTLACMVLPILIRTTEESLRAVPNSYREGTAALGISQWSSLRHVLLPAAIPGITVGIILSFGRAIAETAALLFTSGYVDRMPSSPLDSGRALSIHIFDLAINVPGGTRRAYATALVLIAVILTINLAAYFISTRWQKKLQTR